MEIPCLAGQGRDSPVHSQTESHSYLCPRHCRYPVAAVHARQALKTHQETHRLLDTVHSPSLHNVLKSYYKLIITLENVLDDYSPGRTVSPLDPGRPGIPLEPWAPCRAAGERETRLAQLPQFLGHIRRRSVISRWHGKAHACRDWH